MEFVAVSISSLTTDQAGSLAGVRAASMCLCYNCSTWQQNDEGFKPLQLLHAQGAEVHELIACECCDELFSHLCLPSLTKMTIIPKGVHESHGDKFFFTGRTLGWEDMSGIDMQHVLSTLPALTSLSFCKVSGGATQRLWPMTNAPKQQWCWHVLPFPEELQVLDLRGIQGLTDRCISSLCSAFHERQALHAAVRLLLPLSCLDTAECVFHQAFGHLIPRAYQLASYNKCQQLIIAKDEPVPKLCNINKAPVA